MIGQFIENQPVAKPVQAFTPMIKRKVFTTNQAAKMITKPITVVVITDFAWESVWGLPPAKNNIIPPISNIKTAIAGTSRRKIKSKIPSNITKKWHN